MILVLLIIIGLSAGMFASFGLSAIFTSVGIVTRIAYKTKTSLCVKKYEICILLGAVIFNGVYLLEPKLELIKCISTLVMAFFGVFFGLFVGCLSVALAETLDGFTIVFRRIKISKNIEYILLAIALGKMSGSLMYFLIL